MFIEMNASKQHVTTTIDNAAHTWYSTGMVQQEQCPHIFNFDHLHLEYVLFAEDAPTVQIQSLYMDPEERGHVF